MVARNVTWLVLAIIHSWPGIPGKDAITPTKDTQNTIGNLLAYGKLEINAPIVARTAKIATPTKLSLNRCLPSITLPTAVMIAAIQITMTNCVNFSLLLMTCYLLC